MPDRSAPPSRTGVGARVVRPTIRDIAQITGLAKSTVSRAMNDSGRVSAETQRRVRAVLEEQGYSPAGSARALRTGRTGLIALTIGHNRNPNALSAIEGAVDAADSAGLRVVVTARGQAGATEEGYLALFRSRLVDGGILLFPSASEAGILSSLPSRGMPLVAIEPERPIENVSAVYADAKDDGYQATRHLLALGHRRIGIGLDKPGWGEQDRLLLGYRAALHEAGVPMVKGLVSRHGWDFESGQLSVDEWWRLGDRPTAAIFCCDTAALGAVAAVRSRGIVVPQGFSVVGYDDSAVLTWMSPAITSPLDRRRQLARVATELLISRLQQPSDVASRVRVRAPLVLRESTTSPPQ